MFDLKKYYHHLRNRQYQYFISEGKKVLEVRSVKILDSLDAGVKFDYIILPCLGSTEDVQAFLMRLKAFCHADTRIIIEYYCYLWQYIL